jgi:hypothetical protein
MWLKEISRFSGLVPTVPTKTALLYGRNILRERERIFSVPL